MFLKNTIINKNKKSSQNSANQENLKTIKGYKYKKHQIKTLYPPIKTHYNKQTTKKYKIYPLNSITKKT